MPIRSDHHHHLTTALIAAKSRKGSCAPNPSVGAVLVRGGRVIAVGVHQGPGWAHAEVNALTACPQSLLNSDLTLYVTLEPCCHHGRTPPCTDAILRAGIQRVYFAYADPNPSVNGRGQSLLNQAGVVCEQIAHPEIDAFYRSYAHWTRHHRPWVTLKLAITADEAIAHADGKPLAITGSELWRQTHLSRSQSDAILTTAATITADNPALTVRWPHCRSKPLYIIDRKLQTPLSARLFHSGARIVLFYDQTLLPSRCEPYQALGVTCIGVNCDKMGLNLHEIVNIIGQQGCHELWIEAGGINAESWLREELVDELHLYQNTALWMPGSKPAFPKIYSKASLLKMAPSLSAHSFGSEWCYKLCLKPSKEE